MLKWEARFKHTWNVIACSLILDDNVQLKTWKCFIHVNNMISEVQGVKNDMLSELLQNSFYGGQTCDLRSNLRSNHVQKLYRN